MEPSKRLQHAVKYTKVLDFHAEINNLIGSLVFQYDNFCNFQIELSRILNIIVKAKGPIIKVK